MISVAILTGLLFFNHRAHAIEVTRFPQQPSAAEWLDAEAKISLQKIEQNISPSNTPEDTLAGLIQAAPGAVIAARTRENPNYYYHWVRDAGLVVDAYLSQIEMMPAEEAKPRLAKIFDYVEFSDRLQNLLPAGEASTGLGEPKFEVDGSQFEAGWGRPQNDGPALRAISLMHFARVLGTPAKGLRQLQNVIRRDLDYVAEHWREPSVDLWEEVKGDHFYTRMVQHKALMEGSQFVRLNDQNILSESYAKEAQQIKRSLANFWDPRRQLIIPTLNRVNGIDYKSSQLDSSVVLGLLHGNRTEKTVRFCDYKVISTLHHIIKTFAELYPINRTSGPSVAIGRYPEDRYGGSHFNGGNPWPMTTLAVAEAAYSTSKDFKKMGHKELAQEWLRLGDALVLRVKHHAHKDGSLNEQIDRTSGQMTSVQDLTWNYAAILTTAQARAKAVKD